MKKSLLLLVLIVILVLVTAACGKDDDGDDDGKDKDKDKVTEAVTPSEATPTEAGKETTPTPGGSTEPTTAPTPEGADTIWQFTVPTDIGTIDLPETTEEKATVPDNGSEITLLRTEISQPRETVFRALRSDSWITGREGDFCDFYQERGTGFVATENGPRWAVQYTEGLEYVGREYNSSLDLTRGSQDTISLIYTTDTDQFCNENYVELTFYNVDLRDAATQENIKRIVKTVYSERAAEVLLNITTEDDLNGKRPNDLNILLEYFQAEYRFVRSVYEDEGRIRFSASVERSNPNSVKANTYYKSLLAECPLDPNAVFAGNIGNTDLYGNPSAFADKVFAAYPVQLQTMPSGNIPYTYTKTIAPDGREYWSVEYHVGTVGSPASLDIEYSLNRTGDTLDLASVTITGTGYDFGGELVDNFKQQLTMMNSQMEVLFDVNPEIKWEELTTENEQKWTGKIKREFEVLGELLSGEIEITLGTRMGEQKHGEWIVRLNKYISYAED